LGVTGKSQIITCPKGRIAERVLFGAVADTKNQHVKAIAKDLSSHQMNLEQRAFGFNFCGKHHLLEDKDNCEHILKADAVIKKYKETCAEKKSCEFKLNDPETRAAKTSRPECDKEQT
jgi:hypothetical protein